MRIRKALNKLFTRKNTKPIQPVTAPVIPSGAFDIAGVACQVKDGLINLTDLWKASGSVTHQQPSKWLENGGTKEFVNDTAKLLNYPNSEVLKKRAGKGGGTFAHWQIALAYAKWLSPALHLKVNSTFKGYLEADPKMTLDMLERTKNIEDIHYIAARARGIAANKELNGTIKYCGGTGYIYGKVADMNNLAITGKKAKQIRKENNLPEKASTRPLLSTEDTIKMAFTELMEKQALIKNGAKGNEEIYDVCKTAKDSVDVIIAMNS